MKTLFRYSSYDAFLIAQTLFALVLPLTMALADLHLIWYLVLAPIHVMLILNLLNTSLHHHTHWPTFVDKRLNHFYELLISAASGLMPQGYRLIHNVHHKHVNDLPVNNVTKDYISVFAKGVNGNVENAWRFCFRRAIIAWVGPWKNVFYNIIKSDRNHVPPMINYKLASREQLAFVLFALLLLGTNFWYGLWYLGVIVFAAHFLNYSWHYGEHYGSYHHRGDTTQDAVGIYNKWYNTLCFNSGYHQEHHHKPGVHWTKLKEITSALPPTRVIARGMHIANVPWTKDFWTLFKL